MQITINKIPFDVKPVDGPLRAAILAEPVVRRSAVRAVWAWDREAGTGRFLVPTTRERGLAVPMGLSAFVAKAGTNGTGPQKAEGPTRKMAERVLAGVGAKDWSQVMQAIARVVGVPQKTLPFDAFASLNGLSSYQVAMHAHFQVLELVHSGRNLQAFLFLPGLVSFTHVFPEPVEGAPAPGSIRPAFALPAGTKAALAMRRMAVARRLNELKAELGDTRPADLEPQDPRRAEAARLGAEWRALQPKDAPQAA